MANEPTGGSAFGDASKGRFARLESRPQNAQLHALTSKLVPPYHGGPQHLGEFARHMRDKNVALRAPDLALLTKISDTTTANIADAASMFQLLPDTELAMQILVSSILSPKDMVNTELSFGVDTAHFNSEVGGLMVEVIRDHFETDYKISELASKILQDILFFTGSYPMLVLPESSIDQMINSPTRISNESIGSLMDNDGKLPPLGILGNPPSDSRTARRTMSASLENYLTTMGQNTGYNPTVMFTGEGKSFDPGISVVDNPSILKVPMLEDKLRSDRLRDLLQTQKLAPRSRRHKLRASNEGFGLAGGNSTQKVDEKETSLYRRRRFSTVPIMPVTPHTQLKKKSVGHPLVMRLPSESVIPVHVPSDPEDHLGYFVLLDQQGNPLTRTSEQDYYADMAANINANQEMVTQLLQTTKRASEGRQDPDRSQDIQELERIYADLVEAQLKQRLANGGLHDENIKVARPDSVYRIMLARTFAHMQTQVLYVPAEMMTYMAFDYNKYGIGTSLLQQSKIIGGIRALLMFSNTMGSLKNSVARTRLDITLDPNDQDPSSTVEFLMHEYAKTRQGAFPLGASNPLDLVSFLQNSSTEVTVQGNTRYPETKMEVGDMQSQRALPNAELETNMRKIHLMSMGLSPETVDAGANAEFATTVVQNNLLLAKRVILYQNRFTNFLEDFSRKYVISSEPLMDQLREIVRENIDKLSKDHQRMSEASSERAAQAGAGGQRRTDEAGATLDESYEAQVVVRTVADHRTDEQLENAPEKDESDAGIEAVVMDFVEALQVSLPAPDTAKLKNQMQSYDEYEQSLEKALKAYLDASFLEANGLGDLSETIESTIAAVKAYYLRQFLRENNILPELDDITQSSGDDGPSMNLMEINAAHLEGVSKSILSYMKQVSEFRKKNNEAFTEIKDKMGDTSNMGGGSSDMGGSDTGGDLGGDTGSDDDAGGLGDFSIPGLDDADADQSGSLADGPADPASDAGEGGTLEDGPVDVSTPSDVSGDATGEDNTADTLADGPEETTPTETDAPAADDAAAEQEDDESGPYDHTKDDALNHYDHNKDDDTADAKKADAAQDKQTKADEHQYDHTGDDHTSAYDHTKDDKKPTDAEEKDNDTEGKDDTPDEKKS